VLQSFSLQNMLLSTAIVWELLLKLTKLLLADLL
jgi:hypothetical protein